MQDPAREIDSVVHQLTAAASPDLQKRAIHRSVEPLLFRRRTRHSLFRRFFAPDASFRHPLVHVSSAPNSRESILSIYQCALFTDPAAHAMH